MTTSGRGRRTLLDVVVRACLEHKLPVALLVGLAVLWGVRVAPFDWDVDWLPRDPVPVDAIPDLGENQQIVFTEWAGRSPQDVEDQITYPLTVSMLGIPGVRSVRSFSFFGFSSIYAIFEEDAEFYWSRSRVLEKLASLSAGTLPEGVKPALGPDSTALGQIFWYTLEGRDPDGLPAGGWDLDELRGIQDWHVRYSLLSARGISEVASVGGFVREYQVDVDPDAMRAHGVVLEDVFRAVRDSNVDVGARTIEVNRVEYVVRGLGFLEDPEDLRRTVVKVTDNVPIRVEDVANVSLGPALRRGVLDKGGAEAVGGVVVVRYGHNPLQAIEDVKAKIAEIAPGLPRRPIVDWKRAHPDEVAAFATARGFDAYLSDGLQLDEEAWLAWLRSADRAQWPQWMTTSQVTVVPFYDRTGLIHETLGTLENALTEEVLVTLIVVLVMVFHLRSSLLIGAVLPLSVLLCFIAMSLFDVDANIVALSGIAIAIGTMVDMGIILCENILRHLDEAPEEEDRLEVVHRATCEVGPAVLTAVATTVIGFLPVFAMTATEGKLFKPLAFTKTFALVASVIVAITVVPAAAHLLFARRRPEAARLRSLLNAAWIALGVFVGLRVSWWPGGALVALGLWRLSGAWLPPRARRGGSWLLNAAVVAAVLVLLARHWLPLGPEPGPAANLLFAGGLIGGVLLLFWLFRLAYPWLLRWCLEHKLLYLGLPVSIVVLGACVWLGFDRVFAWLPAASEGLGADRRTVEERVFWARGAEAFPGLGVEFMPPLDEGSFLLMPVTMPHASLGEAHEVLSMQDRALATIPEVSSVVGKIGRVESPLDPAPISMVETIINYYPEYLVDDSGRQRTFRWEEASGEFARSAEGDLIPDDGGRPYRIWRDRIRTEADIWDEVVAATTIPGSTVAPRLQPISARLVMLQSGMRAPMGVKVLGPDLATIEQVGLEVERLLKEVPGVEPSTVIADRVLGKPYLEIDLDREALARFGLNIRSVQDVIEVAIGGRQVTTTVEGRERYPVRLRYPRELRDQIDTLGRILVPAPDGAQVPLEQLAEIRYASGPQAIKAEDTFLVSYVIFDKLPGAAEVDVVEACQAHLREKVDAGEFVLPPGVSYRFAGSYENQQRSQKTLAIVLPLALAAIFLVLYLQFDSVLTTFMVFSGILVAWGGGFLLVWAYGQPWFLDFTVFGTNLRDLFQVHPINLSVAIWVGFLALFGIASDDGVVIATYLDQSFEARGPATVAEVREAVVHGASRRIRPALMTVATTILALVPVLTSRGRGADVMVPMAIPSLGGMIFVLLSVFLVPVLYCLVEELKLRAGGRAATSP